MTIVDWAIVALALVLAPIGFRRGLLVAGLGLAGFAAGAAIGARAAPLLLDSGSASPYAPGVALLGGLVIGSGLALLLEGVASALRGRFREGGLLASVDSVGGAVAFVGLALAIAWVAGAFALNAPALRGIRADVQRSRILAAVNGVVPPSGPLLNVLNRVARAPRISGPSADVPPAGRAILDDGQVRTASDSVLHVLGTACGLNVSGSGWVGGPGLVVTNAHVVAGEDDTTVTDRDGTELEATVLVYRPNDDLAVLGVDGLSGPALPLAAKARSGTVAAVLGYPGSGEFTAIPARLGTTGEVTSQDSYGRGPIQRRMTSFRAAVMAGNSGGPVVDGRGRVQTTVFAATVDDKRPQGLGVPNGAVRDALAAAGRADGPVGTGPCA